MSQWAVMFEYVQATANIRWSDISRKRIMHHLLMATGQVTGRRVSFVRRQNRNPETITKNCRYSW